MGRTLRYLGLVVLAVSAWMLIAGEAGGVAAEVTDRWAVTLLQAGGALLVAGLLCALLAPFARWARRGHCMRCGERTERGQTYCMDHLRETVQEYQDQAHRHLS